MKRIILMIALLMPALASADSFYVNVTREDSNLYKMIDWSTSNDDWYVVTKYCYEYVYYDKSIASYTPYGRNKITFKNGKSCDVEKYQRILSYK